MLLKHKKKRLIFCINSGRCGSNYLAELLGSADKVISFHEKKPRMIGRYLRMIENEEYKNSYKKRMIKVKSILWSQLLKKKEKIYCETNHMFIKTFFDVVSDYFKDIDVIILRRNLSSVLKSFLELGYFDNSFSKSTKWSKWMCRSDSKTKAIEPLYDYDKMDQYDKIISYLIDIEARTQRYIKEYPNVKITQVRIEELNNYDNVINLFDSLNLKVSNKTKNIYQKKINSRMKGKEKTNIKTTLDYCEDRINNYVKKAKENQIKVPATLELSTQNS
ncbi:MAG: hypothetical protein K9N07_09955 [Candidatus Cloacimonetes bacterium]|nr:hypothetical protein [Candidatus Cloacimonadota bacterium]